jgi:hypothetical protein
MNTVINERMTARMDKDFVIFLIGMRINKFWKIHQWLPVAMAMPKMIIELSKNKESGFLGYQQWFGKTTIMVQYWESFEKLEAYSRNRDAQHFPAWVNFNKKIKNSGDVGIWHETYQIKAHQYENVYHNMPPFGLGKVGDLIPAKGNYHSAKDRMKA